MVVHKRGDYIIKNSSCQVTSVFLGSIRLGFSLDTRIAGKHFSFPSFFFCFGSAFLGYSILFPNKITDLPDSPIAGKITFF